MSLPTSRSVLTGALFIATLAPFCAATASAGVAREDFAVSQACTALPVSKAFSKIDGDQADYSVAPGGSFEAGAANWTLTGAARVVNGNENLGVATGKRSLVVPVGSSAISPKFCIDETNPHFRFAYKVDSVGMTGFLATVTYTTTTGVKSTQLFSSQNASITPSKWQVSPKSPLATLIPLRGQAATVQIRLTGITVAGPNIVTQVMAGGFATVASPLANLGVTIDSVMVDPYRRS
ncbi:MAG: hypothetical protein Q7T55_15760 [Solirubrobacteraceae bacterium]|nr:hypothetical protein [Solirubrobacteraceae bacterium]